MLRQHMSASLASLSTPQRPKRQVVLVFLAFALAFFLSSLLRAITATLSPSLTHEFKLSAHDLGLLAGGYFLGFALTQWPLGRWLDRHGPKRVILAFLTVAFAGCLAFSWADSFHALWWARVLCGMGFSACLMAPLTAYRRWFDARTQLRANAWMLMTGATGMLAATLPVQWLMPIWGWRSLFVMLGGLVLAAMVLLALVVPAWQQHASKAERAAQPPDDDGSYRLIWRSPYFWRVVPIGFFCHGGMVAIQTLWAGQWMTQVVGWSASEAASGLFFINLGMLVIFWWWGWITPHWAKTGLHIETVISRCLPVSLITLAAIAWFGPAIGIGAAAGLTLFCVGSSVVSLIQPAVGLSFPAHLAGRALSAYNLVVLSGIFWVQWGIGLAVDAGQAMGLTSIGSYQAAWAGLALCSCLSWLFFVLRPPHDQVSALKAMSPGP